MRCSEQTLAKYATQGCGHEFHRYGRDVVYAVEKLDEWAQSRLSQPVRSTSQTATPAMPGAERAVSNAADQSATPTKCDFRRAGTSVTAVNEPARSDTPAKSARGDRASRKPTKRRKKAGGGILDAEPQTLEK
jgi:hypothetical protein